MWQCHVEIEHYLIATLPHLKYICVTELQSVKGGVHMLYIDLSGIHTPILHA